MITVKEKRLRYGFGAGANSNPALYSVSGENLQLNDLKQNGEASTIANSKV